MQTALADIRNDVEVLKHQDPEDSIHDIGYLEQIKALQDSQAATNQCLVGRLFPLIRSSIQRSIDRLSHQRDEALNG